MRSVVMRVVARLTKKNAVISEFKTFPGASAIELRMQVKIVNESMTAIELNTHSRDVIREETLPTDFRKQ